MAPEQAEGRIHAISPATDVWALGVILYELLTGRRPFQGDSAMLTLQKVCVAEPAAVRTLRPEVPSALAAVVERCLRKKPEERYPTAAALADDLKRWPANENQNGKSALLPSRREHRPKPLLAALVGIGFVAVLFWLLHGSPEPGPQPASRPAPALQSPFQGWIDILVSEPNNKKRQLLRLHEPEARPLRPGDEVRVEVGLKERPGYVYVLWIDAKGKVIPIYPWLQYDWSMRPAQEQPVSGRLLLPEDGTVYPIEPTPEGLETLLMLVRDTPLPADADVPGLLGDLGAQSSTDREYVRWFENYQVVTSEPDRAPGGRAEASDPAERTQGRIRQRLGAWFAFSRAVSFFNLGQR
jgi:hypothetical protein